MIRAAVRDTDLGTRLGPTTLALIALIAACAQPADREWIAGDHHIHSRYSVGWDRSVDPPSPIVGGDAIYPIPMNALMARHHGLGWMVATDHGGPNHSKVSLERSYPELLMSRAAVPEVIQFFGMELDTPGADHSSLIVPHTHDEAEHLATLEHDFAKYDAWPLDSLRDTEPRMLEALAAMSGLEARPVVIANHPSRSASDLGEYGLDTPAELRGWNDAAPEVAVGMAGAPGHQARTLEPDGSLDSNAPRGAYARFPTMGGFDQLTARLGGFWDSMLGEGRNWWITANSDSHVNWREGGADFWPGEYSKTYVLAERSHDDILEGLRAGRIFVTTGDLVSEVDVFASAGGRSRRIAGIGGELVVDPGAEVEVTVRVRDPARPNFHGDNPVVARIDLIVGEITGRLADPAIDRNPTTHVEHRFTAEQWRRDGEVLEMRTRIGPLERSGYLRVRGTNTDALEPEPDPRGEDPWTDLWFYSNPIFLTLRPTS